MVIDRTANNKNDKDVGITKIFLQSCAINEGVSSDGIVKGRR
jgi:hypothetical protein